MIIQINEFKKMYVYVISAERKMSIGNSDVKAKNMETRTKLFLENFLKCCSSLVNFSKKF